MDASISESGFDVVVIGAGVLGLAAAARLASESRSVLILERESGIARGVTSRNSEVIHAGIYYPAGSLKAEACVEGRERLYRWCAERRVDHRKLGKLIVSTAPEEDAVLEDLRARGTANGVVGLEIIDQATVRRLEPEVEARAALLSPETGIVDAHGFCLSLLAESESRDAVLALEREVISLVSRSHGWQIEVGVPGGGSERIDAGIVIDAAGLDSDRVAARAGLPVDRLGWRQYPCKGDYFGLGPGPRATPSRLIYPVPQQAGLGIHSTLDLAGRVRFGPDAEYIADFEPDAETPFDFDVDPAKAEVFREAAARYLPGLAQANLVPDYAGIRPKLAGPGEGFRDFVIEEASSHGAPGFVACIGIESPGLTAALALARRIEALATA